MSRYNSDALDEACEEMLGHTNWAYGRNPNEEKIDCVVFFYKDNAHTFPHFLQFLSLLALFILLVYSS